MRYVSELVNQIYNYSEIAVFGARTVAREVAGILMEEPYRLKISCFIVSNMSDNPKTVMNKPVILLENAPASLKEGLIIVASMEKNLSDIMYGLHERGFINILPLTFESDIFCEIRANSYAMYYERIFKRSFMDFKNLSAKAGKESDIHIYRVISHLDKSLNSAIGDFSWEIPIQVGRVLTDKTLCETNDAMGNDNISVKNRCFCELTALYWIWKNDTSRFKGLCHYRRHFKLGLDELKRLAKSDVDAVLTIPIYNEPDVYTIYSIDHIENDWQIMMEILKKLHPEYLDAAKMLATSKWYYAYNMFIARDEVFDDYCSFLFPILFECEKRIGKREDYYQGRYIGFLAERLMSIYFIMHKEYNIVHCIKHFMT